MAIFCLSLFCFVSYFCLRLLVTFYIILMYSDTLLLLYFMKLHLPSKLRAAVLACVVAFSPVAYTVSTGTLLFTALSTTPAFAVTETIGQNTVGAGGDRRRIFGQATVANGDAEALPAIVWTADDTVIMDFTSGFFGGGGFTTNVGTIIVRDWLMTGGSSSFVGTFNSDLVSPDDFATMADSGDIQAGAAQEGAWTFNGDHSGFQGDFVNFRNGTNTWTINFLHSDGPANLTAVSGTGAIRNHADKATARTVLVYQYFDDGAPRTVTIENSSIEAYDMALTAAGTGSTATTGADYTVNSALNVTNFLSVWNEATAVLTHGNNSVANVNIAVANSRLTIGNGMDTALTTVTAAITNAGSIHVANNATLTTGGQISGAGSLHVAAGGTLNINGTLVANATAIENAGTLNFGADAIIDLSVLGLLTSYTIVEGGTLTGFTDLDISNLTGVNLAGREAIFGADGTITLTIDGTEHVVAGSVDPIDWAVGTIFDAATGAFAEGDAVVVEGDATLVMTETILASLVTVDTGVELTLESEAGETNQLNATINVDGTLVVVGDALHDDVTLTSTDTAAAGTVRFDIGAGNEINYGAQVDDFTGNLVVASGQLTYQGTNDISGNDTYDIEVLAGATLKIASVSLGQADIVLNGTGGSADNRATLDIANSTQGQTITANGFTAAQTLDAITNVTGLLTVNGDMEWTANQIVSLNGGMTGTGLFTKKGTSTIAVNNGNLSFDGDIVVEAGIFQIGNAGADELNPGAINSITVENGAQLRMFHDETDMSSTTLTLRGATLHNQGMGTSTTLADVATLSTYTSMQKLIVEDAPNTISFTFKGRYLFGEMSGDANLTFTSAADSGDNGEYRIIIVDKLANYSGTISQTYADGVANRFYINNVQLSEGDVASVTAQDVYAFDFAMTGAGSLSLAQKLVADSVLLDHAGTLVVTGDVETSSFKAAQTGTSTLSRLSIADGGVLHMNYEGNLTITELALASTSTLVYGAGAELLHVTAADITALDVINVSVLDLDRATLAAGIELGISTDIATRDIQVFGYEDYDLVNNGSDFWRLTIAEDAVFDIGGWDVNWGTEVLIAAPEDSVTTVIAAAAGANSHVSLFNGTSSGGVAYTSDGITTATITGGGNVPTGDGNLVYIYGGGTGAAATTNSWINVEGGDFFLVAGGGASWNPQANFTGSSHVVINQDAGSVAYVVGGIQQDANNPTFAGDSYVSIFSNTVTGSVIGGNTTIQNGTTTFSGDSNVYVYTPLNLSSSLNIHTRAGDLAGDYIIGSNARGSSSATNSATVSIHQGDSQVTIDLSDYTGAATTFTKQIIGNGFVSNSHSATHTGNSTVSITGHADVEFEDRVRGGSFVVSGTNTLNGNTNVEIMSGTFSNRIIGADEISTGTTTINGSSSVHIVNGSFADTVIAGFNQAAGTTSIAGSSLMIEGGSFASVVAGSLQNAGTMTNTGGTNLTISGGTFSSIVTGGSVQLAGSTINTTADLVDINITGGSFTDSIIGGSQLAADFAGSVQADGGVSLTVDGATTVTNGMIIGGHSRSTGSADSTITVGEVFIKLYGGQINGDIYAAGYLGETPTAGTVTTDATSVAITDAAKFGSDVIIDAGFGGAGAAGGTVLGEQVLILEGEGAFAELADVSFKSFDTVDVQDAAASASLNLDAMTLTKIGAGTLILEAADRTLVEVEAGTLALGSGTVDHTLTAVNISDGAAIDLSNDRLGISGTLTLDAGSTLKMDVDKLTAATATELGVLSVGATADNKLTLDLGGETLTGNYELTLFQGLTSIEGITFSNQVGQLAANAGDYFEGLTGFLVQRDGGSTLVLTDRLVSDLVWLGGNGNFSDVNWDPGTGIALALVDTVSVIFNETALPAGGATVTLDADYELVELTVEGAGSIYTFDSPTSNSLTLSAGITVTDGAQATFEFQPILGAAARVTIGENSILTFTPTDELGLYALSSVGQLTTGGTLSLQTATSSGGHVTASALHLATGTDNSFSQLNITGNVINTGSLTVSGTSSIGSLSGEGSALLSGGLSITDGATLTIEGSAIMRALSNKGSLIAEGGMRVTTVVTEGGDITVGTDGLPFENLLLAEGHNIFDKVILHGSVSHADAATLTVGDGSSITGSIANGSLISSGTVSVGSLNLAQLTNTGTLTVTESVTLNEATTQGGIIDVGTELSLVGANTFTSVEAASISSTEATDSLSVSADSSTGSIGTMHLSVTDEATTFTVTGDSATELSSLAGAGSLELTHAASSLSLQAASSGKNLTIASGDLGLGGALQLTGDLATGAALTLTLNYQPILSAAAIKANAITGASSVTLNITEQQLTDLALSNTTSYDVTDLTTDLTGIGTLAFNSLASDVWIIGQRTYTLDIVDGDLNISVVVEGNTWQGADGQWDDETTDWSAGVLPIAGTEAFFFGAGSLDVDVKGDKVVGDMEVSDDYTFTGDQITTDQLAITAGTTTVSNDIAVNTTTTIADGAQLKIAVSDAGDTPRLDTSRLLINTGAQLLIGAEGAVSVSVAGTQSQGTIRNDGQLELAGDGVGVDGTVEHVIDSLYMDALDSDGQLILRDYAEASIVTLDQAQLSLSTDSKLTITGSGMIHDEITNAGIIDASAATSFIVGSAVSAGGQLDATHLILMEGGSTFGDLRVDTLELQATLTTTQPQLITDELTALSAGSSIILDVAGLNTSLTNGNYTLVSATGTDLGWNDVVLEDDTATGLNELIYSGKDVIYSTKEGELSFTVADATERRWLVSNNFAVTPGLNPGDTPDNSISPIVENETINAEGKIIAGELKSYSVLDTVQDIYVDVDYRLDLSQLTLADSDLDGAVLRNVAGEATLILHGSGSEGNAADTSLVTLQNGEKTSLSGLALEDIIVHVSGIGNNAQLQLESLQIERSVLEVQDQGELHVTESLVSSVSTLSVATGGTLSVEDLGLYNGSTLGAEGRVTVAQGILGDGGSITSLAGGDIHIDKLIISEDADSIVGGTGQLIGAGGSLTVDEIQAGAESMIEGTVTLGSGSYLGSYGADTTVNVSRVGELVIATGDSLQLVGQSGANITLHADASNRLQSISTTNSSVTIQSHELTITESSTMTGGTLNFTLDAEEVFSAMAADPTDANAAQIITVGSQLVLDGTHLVISQSDETGLADITQLSGFSDRVLADLNTTGSVASVTLQGAALTKYFTNVRYSDGQIIADLNTSIYSGVVSTANGLAGAELMNGVLFELNPQIADPATGSSAHPDLKKVLDSMDSYIASGNAAAADQLAAAFAGSSVTAMGGAMLGTVDRQLASVRNRAISMNGMIDSQKYLGDASTAKGWINAESSNSTLDSEGTAAGYDYSSFGGSVGVDFGGVKDLNFGFALSALYGTLTADAPDNASGDLNTVGVSAYAHLKSADWTHSFIASVNLADATLDRTVNVQNSSYTAKGDTSGYGIGLMYEVAYSYQVGEEGDSILQPIFNASFVHATLDGYTEQGSDAGLTVGEQESTYLTLGIGGRLQTRIGETSFNRSATLSLRAMLEADLGDRYTSANMSIAGVNGQQTVTGAQPGNVGGEIGAGLNIPVGYDTGAIFFDASVEFRQGQSDLNATVGYSFSF